jgi:hypothetical protein
VFICESCAILSLQGLFVRVVLFYHYMVYLWELCYSIITWFICESCAIRSLHVVCESCAIRSLHVVCESCAILSLHGLFVRVVLFYYYMVYLWELCYSIITGFICEICAILSLQCVFVRVVLFYRYMVKKTM